jgi:hypothetical protein
MTKLADRIETIEQAYEYMLDYAGQDRASDSDGGPTEIRAHLRRAEEAMAAIAQLPLAGLGAPDAAATRPTYEAFLAVLREDAGKSREAIGLALAQPVISSRLIDNLSGLIHVRALLTDLFLIDETLNAPAA